LTVISDINYRYYNVSDSLDDFEALFKVILCKGKGLDTCYSAADISQTRDQQRFTVSEVAADWHEPIVLQRIMWPSISRDN